MRSYCSLKSTSVIHENPSDRVAARAAHLSSSSPNFHVGGLRAYLSRIRT